jgi:resuscitation-promoting factor RpfA
MTGGQARVRRAMRGLLLLGGLLALGLALLALVGTPPALLDTVASAGDLGADPVEVVLAALGLLAELLTAYLVVVVGLATAGQLGLLGQRADRAFRLVGVPIVRRSLEAALGGVLAVGLLAGPVASGASAQERSTPADAVTAGVQSAAAGATTGVAGAGLPRPGTAPAGATGQPGPATPRTTAPPGAASPSTTTPPPSGPDAAGPDATPSGGATAAPIGPIGPAISEPVISEPAISEPTATRGGSTAADPVRAPGADRDVRSGQTPADGGDGGSGSAATGSPRAEREARAHAKAHVVAPGDTLWDIAARQLPTDGRSNAAIADHWQRIYAANRTVIGADPDLILPGMRLVLPAPGPHAR